MKIIVAPDSFKGSLTAREAVSAITEGIHKVDRDIKVVGIPLSDGGEGFVDVLTHLCGGTVKRKKVTGPLGAPVYARYGLIERERTAIIETASAAGLALLKANERQPLYTTTYGVGELVLDAVVADGCRKVIIGAGGSATVDGGVGMLQALGVEFLDKSGSALGRGAGALAEISSIRTGKLVDAVRNVKFTIAADVTNPLLGPCGAAAVYGPQKGATPQMVRFLEQGLRHYCQIIKKQFDKDIGSAAGGGAAGGLAAGAYALLAAEIVSGAELVLEAAGFEKKLGGCSIVFTGEGRTDLQTMCGKAPLAAAQIAAGYGVPVICLSGSLGSGIEKLYEKGFTAFFSIADGPLNENVAMKDAARLLKQSAENVMRILLLRKG